MPNTASPSKFEIRTAQRDLLIDGTPVTLGARAFDVLAHLHAHRDRVVSKQELLEQVWGGLAVEEGNLTVQISTLRKLLGQRAISTVPGVGYQLTAPEAPHKPKDTPQLPEKPSLAVLPFANLTGAPGKDYLVDGIITDLIAGLSRISGIFVIAATSSFRYKGRAVDLADVGRELGVRYVLEGSIQQGGDTYRITTQLVEAETGHTIWSKRFTGAADDIFDLQDKMTEEVAGAIEPTLILAEARRTNTKPTDNPQAYELCLQAIPYLMRIPTRQSFDAGVALLDRAIAMDPGYALAKAWKCRAHVVARAARLISLDDAMLVVPLADTLLANNRDDALVLAFAGITCGYLGHRFEHAAQAARQAMALNPNSVLVLVMAGWSLTHVGSYSEAIGCFERAIRLDPLGHSIGYSRSGIGVCLLFSGNTEASIAALETAYTESPEYGTTVLGLIEAYWTAGRAEDARLMAEKLAEMAPGLRVSEALAASPHRAPHEQALIRAALEGVGFPD